MFDQDSYFVDGSVVRVKRGNRASFSVVQPVSSESDFHVMSRRYQIASAETCPCSSAKNKSDLSSVRACWLSLFIFGVLFAILAFSSSVVSAPRSLSFDVKNAAPVLVRPGDSIWSIAEEHPVDGYDTRAVAQAIVYVNGLKSKTIHDGMRLMVPKSSGTIS